MARFAKHNHHRVRVWLFGLCVFAVLGVIEDKDALADNGGDASLSSSVLRQDKSEKPAFRPHEKKLLSLLHTARPGDVIEVPQGEYHIPLVIDKSLILHGNGAIIDGGGVGHAVLIDAPNVHFSGFQIRHSGSSLEQEHSGVFLTQKADFAVVENNRLSENLIGIYLKGPEKAVIRNNKIFGRTDLRVNERGNGVHIWNSPGSEIIGNYIQDGRDGIFTTTSKENLFKENSMKNVRFAVHYMYTNDSRLIGNRSENNYLGYAIMYSHDIILRDNHSRNDAEHGFLFNYSNAMDMTGNQVRDGGKKCLFLYNSHKNNMAENIFSGCQIGVHITAGSQDNILMRNGFVSNRTQVKYIGTSYVEWSHEGQGNYWSDYTGYDWNNDGIGDVAYKPNSLADYIIWQVPAAKLLLSSPALQLLKWAGSRFPAIFPGGVQDSAPLMDIPDIGSDLEAVEQVWQPRN